jgi:c-di-GMP-binding flagellar brake protein YcgR
MMDDERREDRRLQANDTVAFKATGPRGTMMGHGTLVDVSDGGCQVRSDESLILTLAPGDRLELAIYEEPDGSPTGLRGYVVWSGDHHFGMQFQYSQSEQTAHLRNQEQESAPPSVSNVSA